MKEKEWQKFAVQSVTLLAVVLIISFFFMEDIMKDNGTNGTAATKNMKTLQELNAVPSYETSVLSDEAHVKKKKQYIHPDTKICCYNRSSSIYDK